MSAGLSNRAETVGVTWERVRRATRSDERAARRLHAAEREAGHAAQRYKELRAAATGPDGSAPRGPLPTWQQLLLLVVGGGLLAGLLIIWLLAAAYVGPASLLALPVTAGLVAGLVMLRWRRRGTVAPPRPRRPLVGDLVRAAQELQDAEDTLRRERDAAANPPEARPAHAPDRIAWRRSPSGARPS